MAKIEAFQSIHFNPEFIENISNVVCPPYDIIDGKAQDEYYQKDPYNIIRLILGKELGGDSSQDNKYTRAAAYLEDWLRRMILIQDAEPAIYAYEQNFAVFGAKKTRIGFLALMRLDEEGKEKTVYPHEHTHTAPKEDRLRLIKHVEANLSPIFTIFSDPKSAIIKILKESMSQPPLFKAIDAEGFENNLWRITQKSVVEDVKSFFSNKELFIADGHHRYEVAKSFRDYKRQTPGVFKESYNYILTYFTALEEEGLCILPTHRLIKNTSFDPNDFSECFQLKVFSSQEELALEMKAKEQEVGVFGLYKDKKFYCLKIAEKRECNRFIQEGPREYKNLDVVILQKVIFDHFLKLNLSQIYYDVDLTHAASLVDQKEFDALFILNPTKVEQIRSIALGGEVMPQKSTYFYPKLLSGLVIHKF